MTLPSYLDDTFIHGSREEAGRRFKKATREAKEAAKTHFSSIERLTQGRSGSSLPTRDLVALADKGVAPQVGPHLLAAARRATTPASEARPILPRPSFTDDAGNPRVTQNADLIGRLLSESPIYRREAPVVEDRTTGDGRRFIAGVAAKEVADAQGLNVTGGEFVRTIPCPIERIFTDFDTAMRHAPELLGLRPEEPGSEKFDAGNGNLSAGAWLDRRDRANPQVVETARRLLDVLDREINLATLAPRPEAAPVGGSPRVGAFLAGSPNSMWRTTDDLDPTGPVRVFFDLSSIGGGKPEQIASRGAALLALTLAIQAIRPVELWATTQGTARTVNPGSWGSYRSPITGEKVQGRAPSANTIFAMRVGTAPVDVERAAVALGDNYTGVGFSYQMESLMMGHRIGARGGLSINGLPFEIACGADPARDIVIPAISISDYEGGAVAWLRRVLGHWLDRQGAPAEQVAAIKDGETASA